MTDDQLRRMAKTAFDVLNWARREGMKEKQQLEQVVLGFKVDLAESAKDPQYTSSGPQYHTYKMYGP